MQMIWIRMPAQRQKCKEPWIKSHSHVITMISQSAQNDRGCTPTSTWKTVQLTNHHCGEKLKVVDKFTYMYLGSTLFRAVHIDDEVTARIAKPVWVSEDSVQMSGSEMESSLTAS